MLNILLGILQFTLVNFHSLSFQDAEGNTINMSSFQNKKVLIVNIATGSDKTAQLAQLQQLQQQYADSLVVIAFPSNSFGHEPRNNAGIKQFCQENYNTSFIIASKSVVAGSGISPVFDWLARKTNNGEMDAPAGNDFVKYLITKDGMLVGVFSSKVSPMDNEITEAINASY
jgi:glutathione peroxidase